MTEPQPNSPLAALFAAPYPFDFFQAVRLLERAEGVEPVGHDGPPREEAVWFRAQLGHSFPASAVSDLVPKSGNRPVPAMTVSFLGLTGPSGVMPRHYTDMLLRLERDSRNPERHALRDWLDLYNHRLVSLFYRAWTKYRFLFPHERREYKRDEPDAFTQALLSFIGVGQLPLRRRLAVRVAADANDWDQRATTLADVPDTALLRYAGLLAQRPRNAAGLEAMLSDYFQAPVEVVQFHGAWLQLDELDRSRLGAEGGNCALGESLVIGERVWDVEGRILVRLGPLKYETFVEFLPDETPTLERKAFFLLTHLTRFYVGPTCEFDVRLDLLPGEAPECQLGGDPSPGARLGWNTWLVSSPPPVMVTDAIFGTREVFRLARPQRRRGAA